MADFSPSLIYLVRATRSGIGMVTNYDQRRLDKLVRRGRLDQAAHMCRIFISYNYRRKIYCRALTRILLQMQNYKDTISIIEKYQDYYQDIDGQTQWARALVGLGSYDAAVPLLIALIMKSDSVTPIRILRQIPPSAHIIDLAVSAFQRSCRSPYRRAIQSAQLVELALRAGEHDRAARISLVAIKQLVAARPEPLKPAAPMSTEDADQALLDLHALLSPEIPFFLISGTLLGVMRESALLGHDKDIDVGVLETVDLSALLKKIEQSELFNFDIDISNELIKIKHHTGIMIDIFVHYENDIGQVWHASPTHAWHNTKWWNSDENIFSEVNYKSKLFLIPKTWELYLSENYGDWRVSKTKYDASFEAPNRRFRCRERGRIAWRMALIKYYHRGEMDMFTRYIQEYKLEFLSDNFYNYCKILLLTPRLSGIIRQHSSESNG